MNTISRTLTTGLIMGAMILPMTSFAADGADHPCKKLADICTAAGYVKNDHKDKNGLVLDCMKPLRHGQSVAKVTDPNAIKIGQECEAKHPDKK